MVSMARKEILPAASSYQKGLTDTALAKAQLLGSAYGSYEVEMVKKGQALLDEAYRVSEELYEAKEELKQLETIEQKAMFVKDTIMPLMEKLRTPCDGLEVITATDAWPFPTYGKLLFGL